MGFGTDVSAIGIMSIVSILVYLGILYAIVFWIALPAISIVAKMFGFPG